MESRSVQMISLDARRIDAGRKLVREICSDDIIRLDSTGQRGLWQMLSVGKLQDTAIRAIVSIAIPVIFS